MKKDNESLEATMDLVNSMLELLLDNMKLQLKINKAIEYIKEYKKQNYSMYAENEEEIELIDKIYEILGGE